MNQIDLQNIKSNLKLYILRHSGMNDTKLAEIFLEENEDIKLSKRSVRRYASLVRKAEEDLEEDIHESNDQEEEELSNVVVENKGVDLNINKDVELTFDTLGNVFEENEPDYVFELKRSGVVHKIDRVTVDRVICAYSRQGLNLTTGLIHNVLGLSFDIIKAIIYNLNITKESKPYSDYSETALEPSLLYNEMNNNLSYILDKLKENDGTTTAKLNKEYKKAIILGQQTELRFKALVSNIVEELPKVEFNIMKSKTEPMEGGYEHTHLVIPDMHIGLDQSNYNFEIIRDKLHEVLSFIEDSPNLHVHFMGDIIHSVSGLNHKDSWKNMDPSATGAEAIIQPYKLLVEFLSSITNLHSVNFVGGNHDRLQASRDQENTGEGAKLIAFMIQETLEGIPVNFDSYRIIDDADPNMTVIILHGDKPVDKESGQSIAWTHGNPNKFNYILTAHMHSRKQNPKDDGLTFRKEALPAFCPADTYGKTVAHPTLPGFKMISAGADKIPLTVDIPLHYDNV